MTARPVDARAQAAHEGRPRVAVGSLFSGIGGFDLGLERAGFEVAFQCDNDPFSTKVLAHHWPGVRRYDDVRNIGMGPRERDQQGKPFSATPGESDAPQVGHVDLICGGFPCQDLSVAGKRAGLDGARSGLWFEFHRILSELRPTFCLIENVPGLLSSNQGRDFGVVLAGLGQLWPAVGWAILDSQHFGVAQRRRRVYVIGGPSRASVQQILSLCEGGDWHPAQSRAPREDVTPTIRAGANSTGGHRPPGTDVDTCETLQIVPALTASGRGTERTGESRGQDPLVLARALTSHPDRQDGTVDTYVTHSLRADGFDASEDGTGRGTPIVPVAFVASEQMNGFYSESDKSYTLNAQQASDSSNIQYGIRQGSTVRRLTPQECERLQGFPDGWTDVDGAKDGPRYKALGNAVTVPVIQYIGERIMAVLA